MKVDFEAALTIDTIILYPDSAITGCNFHFNQCLLRQLQNIAHTVEYKGTEQI
jgi:hypothetical protein